MQFCRKYKYRHVFLFFINFQKQCVQANIKKMHNRRVVQFFLYELPGL
jgi:hypothetical protein